MGVSLVASGGDTGLAVRALQRALGPRGLPLWSHAPQRAWVEAFPEGRSYVRRLAAKNPYVCPVLGGDLNAIILEGQFALAQAHYRQGAFQEAADLFSKLLQNTAPTTALLARPRPVAGPFAALRPGVQAPAHRPGTGAAERPFHGRLSRPLRGDGPADAAGGQAEERGLGRPAAGALRPAGQRRVRRRHVHGPRRGAVAAGAAGRRGPGAAVRRPGLRLRRRCGGGSGVPPPGRHVPGRGEAGPRLAVRPGGHVHGGRLAERVAGQPRSGWPTIKRARPGPVRPDLRATRRRPGRISRNASGISTTPNTLI